MSKLLKDALESTVALVKERQQMGGVTHVGIPTGFHKFDELTGGLRNGTLGYIGGRPGMGKANSISTKIPTPYGFKLMGELVVGDKVFDEQGKICTVTWVREIFADAVQYRVTFDDGEHIDASADHLWLTSTRASRKSQNEAQKKRPNNRPVKRYGTDQSHKRSFPSVVTTQYIRDTLRVGKEQRLNHAVAVSKPLELPEVVLPIAPYTFGAWLGDGFSDGSGICGVDNEIFDRIQQDGYELTTRIDPIVRGVQGLSSLVKKLGVQGNKHIPTFYLRASYEQRLELLRGLMDTDGHITKQGFCEITQKRQSLAHDIKELIHTLGMKATIEERKQRSQTGTEGTYYRVKFTPNVQVFHLSRKASRWQPNRRTTTQNRYIVSVEPISSVPMRCISVDSPSNLYLAGRAMIPTHNTGLAFTIARNVALIDKKVLYVSLEMKANMLALRFLAGQTGIPAHDIERGLLSAEQLRKVEQVIEDTKNLSFSVLDDSLNSKQLYQHVKQAREETGLDLLVVDYLTLLNDPGSHGQVARVTELSRMMQQTAFDFDIPVIVLSQLNREVERRENNIPTLSDLRDSGAVEQDADWVTFCHRPHYYAMMNDGAEPVKIEDDAKLLLAKNRHGAVGQFTVKFVPARTYWYSDVPNPTPPPNTNMGNLTARVREKR